VHVKNKCFKKQDDLEEKIKRIEGDVLIVHRNVDNFTFQVRNSQSLMSHTAKNEWVVDSGCTHHMEKDSTFFTRFNEAGESRIYVAGDFSLNVVGQGDVDFQHGNFFDIYHLPKLSAIFFSFSQLTQTVIFWNFGQIGSMFGI
jgi:hypothetical protein